MRKFPRKLFLCLFIPISFFLINLAKAYPTFVEKYYSESFYAVVADFLGLITAFFPFSLAEIIIFAIPILIIIYISLTIKRIIKVKPTFTSGLKAVMNCFLNIFLAVCVLFGMYTVMWGINYYRPPLAQLLNVEVKGISEDELYSACLFLAEEANKVRDMSYENENGVFTTKKNLQEVMSGSKDGYEKLKSQYEFIRFIPHRAKPVYLSEGMSYLGISGIYIPHTAEANVNRIIEPFMLPCTLSHEQAHQLGFAREDEANFISFLACINNSDIEFQYSGYMLAFIHTSNALFTQNPEKYNQVIYSLSDGAFRDLKANWDFWKKYESKASDIQDSVNDKFLKVQGQESGIKSYGLMVDLVIDHLIISGAI